MQACWFSGFISLTLPPHIVSLLIFPQSHKPAVPQVGILRPLNKLKLPHQQRLQPPATFHFRRSESRTPAASFLLRQIGERAFLGFQRLEPFHEFGPELGCKTVPCTRSVNQLIAVIIAENQRIERGTAERIAGR